ncbi:transcriptional regulator with XRE-family HTH domain [Crossiella equi]|uniref:Transcriptional regulator with XRE-family HTH domain n=1 Tax=Crossiella equi TaxID=130796 RepID=A0ABS5A968_9PSEU|nr:helix-turn-helix transcriptional regulator [Crossiella equi]MBP2473122.1 transcriptional regulator with XRE-family HTH domain [Crossiella equi]
MKAASEAGQSGSAREQLAARLRHLRELSGVSGRELGRRIRISQSKVSRIETGTVLPTMPEVWAWGSALEAPDDVREDLESLTKTAYTEVHPWRALLHRGGHLQSDIEEREAQASQVLTYQPSVVPGLLQTAEYARRVFTLFQVPYANNDLAAALAARLHRQIQVLEAERRFDFLVTEAALRWRPGPSRLLLAQLQYLLSLSTLENVSFGVVPDDREALATPAHGFVVYQREPEFGGPLVTVEMIHANVEVRDPEDIELYLRRWALLQQSAVFGDEAREHVLRIAESIRSPKV